MLVGRVIHHEVRDHAHSAAARGSHHVQQVAVRAEALVHAVEVRHVVAVVALAGRHERHQPQAVDPEPGEVVQAFAQARQVAATVPVGVEERLDVQAVDRRRSSTRRRWWPCASCRQLGQHVLAERVDERAQVLAHVVQVDLLEAELGNLGDPGRVPGRDRRTRARLSARPPGARAARRGRTPPPSRGPSRAAGEHVRAPLVVRDPEGLVLVGGPAQVDLQVDRWPSPPPSRNAAITRSSVSRGW